MGEIRADIVEEAKRLLELASSEGVPLRVSIHSEGRREAATVAAEPPFDPTMARLRDVAPAAAR